ncbi:MarR family regulatory protein [Staphylococcus aureus]|uniref:MarR family regulatory protein n=1 Tax=Staphylococcus aureus TaxID=1280 RepID=A0A380ENL9_STAAU|nr:MarR family regulatory protein [Staphylococcus aureus]
MLSQEFFNSFITIYRPYLKLAEPILEKHNIYYGQWLILRDIAKHQPTTLIEIHIDVQLKSLLQEKL